MSRAFVSEEAEERRAAALPERVVSARPNLVTPEGLAAIESELARLQAGLTEADDAARPRLLRDLRYWQARRASAQRVERRVVAPDEVVFGVAVAVRRAGTLRRFRIVGEDEADPARALLAYTAPLAVALLGAGLGEVVELEGGETVVVEGIEP